MAATGTREGLTLGILGCGNMGTAILKALVSAPQEASSDEKGQNEARVLPTKFVACCRSESSAEKARQAFSEHSSRVSVIVGDVVETAKRSDAVVLACKPHAVDGVLRTPKLATTLRKKLLISVVAGWTKPSLTDLLRELDPDQKPEEKCWIVRTLPNVAAEVAESLTAIEELEDDFPTTFANLSKSIFDQTGKAVFVAPDLMDGVTSLGGSTPAFFAVMIEALIDAGVTLGFTREISQLITYQVFLGTAKLIQGEHNPSGLIAKGTSPAGCTIKAMVELEKSGIRGHLAQAVITSADIAGSLGKKKD